MASHRSESSSASTLTGRLARTVVRHRRAVAVWWLAILLLGLYFGPQASDVLVGLEDEAAGSESARAGEMIAREFPESRRQTLTLLLTSGSDEVAHPTFLATLQRVTEQVRNVIGVLRVHSFLDSGSADLVGKSNRTTVVFVVLSATGSDEATEVYDRMLKALDRVALPPGYGMELTGGVVALRDVVETSERDLQRSERTAIPLTVVILFFVMGGVLAMLLPVLTGVAAILVGLALVFLVGQYYEMTVYVQNIVQLMGLGFGVDYSLLIVSRFREELQKGHSAPAAARISGEVAGRAVLFSGATVGLGFSALLVPDLTLVRSMAIGGLLVAGTTMAVALTLLPALLAMAGPRISWPARLSGMVMRLRPQGTWKRIARTVMRRPAAFLVVVLVVLVPVAGLLTQLETYVPGASSLPPDAPSRRGLDLMSQEFSPGFTGPTYIVVRAPEGETVFSPSALAAIDRLAAGLEREGRVKDVGAIVRLDPRLNLTGYGLLYATGFAGIPDSEPRLKAAVDGLVNWERGSTVTLVRVTLNIDPALTDAMDFIRIVRDRIIPEAHLGGYEAFVGGTSAQGVDQVDEIYGSLPYVAGFVLVLTFLVLLILLRSVVLPLKTVLENIISVAASMGILVFVFQWGYGEGLFGFESQGAITYAIPVIQFAILFGLSMDYQIFMLTRIREHYDRSGDNDAAVEEGLERTGSIVTSAAAIMVAVFGAFILSDLVFLKEIGLGLAFAVFLDATLVRSLLVPASMKLLADRNWYLPGFLRGRLKTIRH